MAQKTAQKSKQAQAARHTPARKKKRSVVFDVVLGLFVLAIMAVAVVSGYNYYVSSSFEYAVAVNGSLTNTIPSHVIIIRSETPVLAPVSGTLRTVVADGERVTAGTTIAYIDSAGTSTAVTAPQAGIVKFETDGLEEVLSPVSTGTLDWQRVFENIEDRLKSPQELMSAGRNISGASFSVGRQVGKIVDNLADYRLMVYAPDGQGFVLPGNNLTISLGSRNVSGTVEQSDSSAEGLYFLLKINPRSDDYLLERYFEAEILGEKTAGVIIPADAIVTDAEGGRGVFVLQKNILRYKEITVLGIMDKKAAVSGINAGVEVVTNTDRAKDGMRVY